MSYTFMDLMNNMQNGAVSYYTYRNEYLSRGFRLPNIPKGYFLPLANVDLVSDEFCKILIDDLRKKNKELDYKYTLGEQESGCCMAYEDDCFFIALNLGQLFDYWHGKLPFIDDPKLDLEYELLLDEFWDCLKNRSSYEELKEYSNRFYNCYLTVTNEDGELS